MSNDNMVIFGYEIQHKLVSGSGRRVSRAINPPYSPIRGSNLRHKEFKIKRLLKRRGNTLAR